MISFNNTILAIAIVFTILLAVVNVMQFMMAKKGVNPLEAEGNEKIIFIVIMVALIILLLAHLVTGMGNDAVGKNNLAVMLPGGLAFIFAITTTAAFMMKDKLADKAQMVYFVSLALLWICIIGHIAGRVMMN